MLRPLWLGYWLKEKIIIFEKHYNRHSDNVLLRLWDHDHVTDIISGKRSCTIQLSAELLMTGWLHYCVGQYPTESATLHNARKTSASEVHYSQEALYQIHYTYIHDVRKTKVSPSVEKYIPWQLLLLNCIGHFVACWLWFVERQINTML